MNYGNAFTLMKGGATIKRTAWTTGYLQFIDGNIQLNSRPHIDMVVDGEHTPWIACPADVEATDWTGV